MIRVHCTWHVLSDLGTGGATLVTHDTRRVAHEMRSHERHAAHECPRRLQAHAQATRSIVIA
eukprot:3542780-Prymnesium_polylepis.1